MLSTGGVAWDGERTVSSVSRATHTRDYRAYSVGRKLLGAVVVSELMPHFYWPSRGGKGFLFSTVPGSHQDPEDPKLSVCTCMTPP